MKIEKIIKEMTLEEKAGLLSGKTFWETKAIERLQIPSIFLSDGPHGLRKQGDAQDHLGVNGSVLATCFPNACLIASSFDSELAQEVGGAIAEEALQEKVDIVLGPGINIKRSPLCGRNFEYYSEDPFLAGKIGTGFVKGLQNKGIGCSLKHFAINNQENERMTASSEIDERTMREIYLKPFEMVVKEAKPYTVMCSYNRINGVFASDNEMLLNDILRKEWGFDGFVVTDWGALNEKIDGVKAGCDLEMPTSNGVNDKKIVEAVKNGSLDEKYVDIAVKNVLQIIDKCVEKRIENYKYDLLKHQNIARKAAAESIVLLKNEDDILPLNSNEKILVIGEMAEKTRYQGGGSSHINANRFSNLIEEIKEMYGENVSYQKGYELNCDKSNETLTSNAMREASKNDKIVIALGLPESFESEGYDRENIKLPSNQLELIEKLQKVNSNIVAVLFNGSVIEIEKVKSVSKGILECWLGGQEIAKATCDVLSGNVNPCGRLPETFPLKIEDTPSYLNFKPYNGKVNYSEGIFVGYRYYTSKNQEVSYPFGFGLSYSNFKYSNLKLDSETITDEKGIKVFVDIENASNREGKEVVQLYFGKLNEKVPYAKKQLIGFEKINLKPKEKKTVCFEITKDKLAYFDVNTKKFETERGQYAIYVSKNCNEDLFCVTINADVSHSENKIYDRNTRIADFLKVTDKSQVLEPIVKSLYGFFGGDSSAITNHMAKNTVNDLTLRAVVNLTGGQFSEKNMNDILNYYNMK